MPISYFRIILLFLVIYSTTSVAQENKRAFFIEPEYMVGKVVPNYLNKFPPTRLQHGLAVNIGSLKTDSNSTWAKYYNFPQTGISLFYSSIGNEKIFGDEYSIMTFIAFNVFNQKEKPIYFKLSLGAAYFTTYYDSISNRRNVNIGSPFKWSFQAGAYKTISEKPGMNLKLGLIFSHASNGHTQLPNFGLNSALLSLSAQFYKKDLTTYQLTNEVVKPEKKSKSRDIGISYGLGFHEYGDKDGPVGGEKKLVHSTSIFTGKTINHHFRWGYGATYRYYDVYYHQIMTRNLTDYTNSPKKYASNLVVHANAELLMGHISMNVELGINVYKPFYKQYEKDFPLNKQFEGYMKFKSYFKKGFSTRLGLNLYAINANKLPKHNFYIGPYIKANAGQADFSELSFGYIYRIN